MTISITIAPTTVPTPLLFDQGTPYHTPPNPWGIFNGGAYLAGPDAQGCVYMNASQFAGGLLITKPVTTFFFDWYEVVEGDYMVVNGLAIPAPFVGLRTTQRVTVAGIPFDGMTVQFAQGSFAFPKS